MHEAYEYRAVRGTPGRWDDIDAAERVGLWTAEIGSWADERVWLVSARAAAAPERLDIIHRERLVATARPLAPARLDIEPGVYAHRWFEIDEDNWPEFLSLSTAAWPSFEAAYPGTEILGFFRSLDALPPMARVLLITRYPSLAVWEQSRGIGGEARDAFLRRRVLTKRTVVRTWRAVP